MVRSRAPRPVPSLLLLSLLASLGAAGRPVVAAAVAAGPPGQSEPPALTQLWVGADGVVRAATDPDSAGVIRSVAFDAGAKRWSRPAPGDVPAPGDSLAAVRVFVGGIFDKYPVERLPLGGGFVLAHRDTGFALLGADGTELGWPPVTEETIDDWSGELRLGLPRDYPADQLRRLLYSGLLRNVPGPIVRDGTTLWFGLAGGFAGGSGQMGGLVAYDTARGRFQVVRHKFIVDAAVTRLFARDGELWIGTARYGPTALEGLRGLLLYRPARREWRQFSTLNSRISGNLIWDLAAEGGRYVWASTNRGVSRYDRTRRLWDSWYWHPADDGGWRLIDRRPENLADELIK